MNPDWGKNNTVAADGIQSDDASLDVDQQWGLGPENVTHNKPFDGTYTVAVHYYCSHQDEDSSNPSFGNSTPTINIFIQGALAWTGSYPGFKDGYLWQAAQVVVANNATNITVVPLNITPTDVHEGCAQ